MRALLLSLIIFGCFPAAAHAVWFDSNWDYRVKVEVVPTRVGTTSAVTNFPVFNDCGGFPASFWTNVQGDGEDIRVVESDEITETPFELVSFSTTSQRCELHFLADSLATTSTSTFYVYYGNPSASAYAVTDTFGRNNTWPGYAGVYHMQHTNTSTSTSSTGSNDLINNGSTPTTTGQFGAAANFANVASRYLYQNNNLGLIATSSLTVTLWWRIDSETTGEDDIWQVNWATANGSQSRILYEHNGGTKRLNSYRFASTNVFLFSTSTYGNATWRHTALVYSSTSQSIFKYINAINTNTGSSTGTQSLGGTSGFDIGSTRASGYTSGMNGAIDEFRVRQSPLSEAWIITEYNNQSSTSTFFVIGAEETEPTLIQRINTIIQNATVSGGGIIQ